LFLLKKTVFKEKGLPSAKDIFQPDRKKEWVLLLLVSLPIIGLGLVRSVYPDQGFDTIHYELYLQDFDFRENKINFAAGGKATYFFPLSERVFGFFRHLLGFRLGTLCDVLLLVTIIVSSYDFIKNFLAQYAPNLKINNIIPALFSLYIVLADNALFNVGSYKTDLIGIPFLLELLHLIFFGTHYSKKVTYLIFFGIASLTVAFKITNIPVVGLLGVIFFLKNLKTLPPALLLTIPLITLLFPGIYLLYNELETGNPVFPLYNDLIHSPLFAQVSIKDTRWGPITNLEALYYHITCLFDKTRISEWQLYSYRFLLGYLTSIGIVIFYLVGLRKNKTNLFIKQLTFLCLIALAADYFWAITTGYSRYGIFQEVVYGIIVTFLFLYNMEKIRSVLLLFAIFLQSAHTFHNMFMKQINLSWHDYQNLFYTKDLLEGNARMLLHDYGKTTDKSNILSKVDAFVTFEPCLHDGIASLLNTKAAIYDLSYNRTEDSVNKFEREVVRPQSQAKNLMAVCQFSCLETDWIKNINKKGYLATDMYEVYPDFMKNDEPVFLFKIKYFDTSKYSITSISKYISIGNPSPTDSVFTYQSTRPMKAFIREAPYMFDWPLTVYELNVNNKKYEINSKSKENKIITLETDNLILGANQPKSCLVIIQELQEKKQ
jgi:hypothetical protein